MLDTLEASKGAESGYADTSDFNGSVAFSRYEITAAWPSIVAGLADCGDYKFSAAITGTILEAGDIKATPFPLYLTYIGETENNSSWGYQQICENPEFVKRVQTILEDRLQTKVSLSIKTRAYTQEERVSRENALKSPFEKDCESIGGLRELVEKFMGELVYSRSLEKITEAPTGPSPEDPNDN